MSKKCMTCGAPFEASPKEHICSKCDEFFERIKEAECPLRTELVRLMNSQEIAPPITPQPHAAEAVKIDKCPICGGICPMLDPCTQELIEKIARLEAAGDAMVNHLHFCRENAVPPHQQDIYPLDINWQSAKQ